MARADLLSKLYLSSKSALEFNFDALQCNYNIYNIFSPTDIGDINYIITSVKYMGDVKTRIRMIEDLMKRRGFKKYHAGTNRQVYVFLDDRSFIAKTPIDSNGMKDNITEFNVQTNIKPCCTKTFQTTEAGEIAFCEKVDPIQTKEEFLSVADDIFYMLVYKILGKYIMDDIGTLKFMNYGIRRGWGPVVLDYAKTFKLDGNKLICNKELYPGIYCNGEIDYDEGFNNIICKSCGTHYNAMELAELSNQHKIILSKGDFNMNVRLIKRNYVVVDSSKGPKEMEVIKKQNTSGITPRLNRPETSGPVFEDESNSQNPDNGAKYTPPEYDWNANLSNEGDSENDSNTEDRQPDFDGDIPDEDLEGYTELADDIDIIPEDEADAINMEFAKHNAESNTTEDAQEKEILPKPLKNLQELNKVSDDKSLSSRPAPKKRKKKQAEVNSEIMDEF